MTPPAQISETSGLAESTPTKGATGRSAARATRRERRRFWSRFGQFMDVRGHWRQSLTDRQRMWFTSLGILAFAIVLIAVALSPLQTSFGSSGRIRESVRAFGWFAPVVIVLIEALQVIVAPIPGQAIDLANGYLFGWQGLFVSLAGIALGTVAAIGLAKRFGRPLVERLITPKGFHHVRSYVSQTSQWLFFVLFLLPGTPDDLLCYAIGLSSIPFRRAVVIALVGRTPSIAAAVLVGATGQTLNPLTFSVVAFAVSLAALVIIWKTPLGGTLKWPSLKIGAWGSR